MKRIFIAISCPNVVKQKVSDLKNRIGDMYNIPTGLKKLWNSFRFVEINQLHITLSFIGNTDEKKFLCLRDMLSAIVFHETELFFEDADFFPSITHPSVFVVKIKKNTELADLKNSIDDVLSDIRIETEKRSFVPHLTIARFRKNYDLRKYKKELKDVNKECGAIFQKVGFKCSEFSLFSSRLTDKGAVYTIERTYNV